MGDARERLSVEVVYALPGRQESIDLEVPRGTTIRAAVERSRIGEMFPEIDLAVNAVGIFGQLRDPGDTVRDGDRVEIYRPLLIDPKEARRRRADAAKHRVTARTRR